MKTFLTDAEDKALRSRIARLRSQMFDLPEEEQEVARLEIERLKREAAPTWDARAAQREAEQLTRMGY